MCGTFDGRSSDGGGAQATATSSVLSGRSAACAPSGPAAPIEATAAERTTTRATTKAPRNPRIWLLSLCLVFSDDFGLELLDPLLRLREVLAALEFLDELLEVRQGFG